MWRKHFLPAVFITIILALTTGGQWYPGIIHPHTNFSDGGNNPAELASIVQSEIKKCRNDGRAAGFMIVTDHYNDIAGKGLLNAYPAAIRATSIAGQFVAIPGLELGSKWRPETDTVAIGHILAIGKLPNDFDQFSNFYDNNGGTLTEKFDCQQEIINQITSLGMLPVAAHPSQLLIGGSSILRTDHRFNTHFGYNGVRIIEMFNVLGPGQEEESIQFYLRLISEGLLVFVTSGSDYHGTLLSAIPDLALGALSRITWVYADDLSEDGILRAITEGKTYAAQNNAKFGSFQKEGGQNPGFQVVGVDSPIVHTTAYLKAEQVEFIIYCNGQEVFRQKRSGDKSRVGRYSLGENGGGWLDPDATTQGVRNYVIRVMATNNGSKQTVLVTSPIRMRLRAPGQTTAEFFEAIVSGETARVASFLQSDPSFADSRCQRLTAKNETVCYHSSSPLALSVATALNNAEILHLLLDAGANPNDNLYTGEPGPLMNAAYIGSIPISDLLLQHGADINICTDGNTPLIWAIDGRHADLAKWLIDHGADINHPGDSDLRPLTLARKANLPDIVKILVTRGAQE